jgi:hypothetical protein
MNDRFLFFAAAASLLFASGSASSEQTAERLPLYPTIGVDALRAVEATRVNDGIVVSGTIRKRFHSRHMGFDHIHVDLLDRTGKTLTSERVDVCGPRHTNRNSRRFTATVTDLPDGTAAIRVSSHRRWEHSAEFNS